MRLKHIFFSGILALAVFSCTQKNQVKIKGEIKNGGNQKVYLEQMNVSNVIPVDSTTTNGKGQFKFKKEITTPTFYNVRIGKNLSFPLLAEPDAQIELSGTFDELSQIYWVEGSEGSLWLKILNTQLKSTQTAMDSLRTLYKALPEETAYDAERENIATQWDTVTTRQIRFSKDFILKHAVSPAAYYALYQKFDNDNFILTPEENLHSYKVVATALKAMYPESQYTQAILKHLDLINKNNNTLRLQQFIANSATTLPEIELPDRNGDTLALSSLKAKFIVLDFTALSSQNGKAYSGEMKNIYNKFRNKGVEIYQVCLDPNRLQWESLIKQYDITWPCVWDADAMQSRVARHWNVKTIPANYIINSKSEIVGKNLQGKRLEDRLNDLLK